MIPVRMYQDDRQLTWGNINIFQNQLFIGMVSIMGPARFLCATLLNDS